MSSDPLYDAITSLTLAARQTQMRGGAEEPVDFADIAAHVLTSVAANIGSVDDLLAGRPGSWEAALVHDLVEGTAPADMLHTYATEVTGGPDGSDPE